MTRSRAWLAGFMMASVLVGACRTTVTEPDPPHPRASPQAKAVPAPLATVPAGTASAPVVISNPEAGPPPQPLRGDVGLSADTVGSKDIVGYTLRAVIRASDVAGGPRAPEVSAAGVEAARKKTEPRLVVDMSPTRMRMVAASPGFVLPEDTELRARVDRYGHVLILPVAVAYRIAAPGTLRALIGERRLDVAPLGPADQAARGEGQRRLGMRTRRVEVVTRAANASFEISRVSDLGEGGVLLCRALLDLMNAPPSLPLCASDEVPLHAELRWTTHGSIIFDAVSFTRRTDLVPQLLAAPPPGAIFTPTPPPHEASAIWLSPSDLAALRTSAVDVPAPDGGAVSSDRALVLQNATDEVRVAWLDGIATAWMSPGETLRVLGLTRGRYVVQWRTFLGDSIEAPQSVFVPGSSKVGESDAGP